MKKNVAVVEDNEDISEIISFILDDERFNLRSYLTATTFNISLIEELPDLIILDIMLPDGNGLDICKKMKSINSTSHIPVVLMSANFKKAGNVSVV